VSILKVEIRLPVVVDQAIADAHQNTSISLDPCHVVQARTSPRGAKHIMDLFDTATNLRQGRIRVDHSMMRLAKAT